MKSDTTRRGIVTFVVVDHGERFLATRDRGRACRTSMEKTIRSAPSAHGLVIDFTGIEAMTISFADEFIGKFYAELASAADATMLVRLRGLGDETEETIRVCLERRDQISVVESGRGVVLLAAASHLVDTYERARSLAEFSALDLADALDVTAQNINNRLRRLVAAGALLRRRLPSGHGGKEFSYRTEPPPEAADESSAAAARDPAARRHQARQHR